MHFPGKSKTPKGAIRRITAPAGLLALILFSATAFAEPTVREQWFRTTGGTLPKVSSQCEIQIYHIPKTFYEYTDLDFPFVDQKKKIVDLREYLEYIGMRLAQEDFAYAQKDSGECVIGTSSENHSILRSLTVE